MDIKKRRPFLWNGLINALSLKSGNTWFFKLLLILDNAPGHPEPSEFNTEGVLSGQLASKHVSNSALRSAALSISIHDTLWKRLSMLQKSPP